MPQFHKSDIISTEFILRVCLHVGFVFKTVPVFLYADHPAKGGVAGVQLSSGCRRTLHLHSGGTRTESVLQRRQRQTAPPAPGESTRTRPHVSFYVMIHRLALAYSHLNPYRHVTPIWICLCMPLFCPNPPRDCTSQVHIPYFSASAYITWTTAAEWLHVKDKRALHLSSQSWSASCRNKHLSLLLTFLCIIRVLEFHSCRYSFRKVLTMKSILWGWFFFKPPAIHFFFPKEQFTPKSELHISSPPLFTYRDCFVNTGCGHVLSWVKHNWCA